MTVKSMTGYAAIIIFITLIHSGAPADGGAAPESSLTIPWEEFKKFLSLDKNQVVLSMETFRKLIAQTGIKSVPRHVLSQGNVILSQDEFRKLVDEMKPPKDKGVKPPFEFIITRAAYHGKMGRDHTSFTADFSVHVLTGDRFLKIPILPQALALEEVKVNDKPALVVRENGFYHVVLSKTGPQMVRASFSMPSSIEKGPHKIDIPIRRTPISSLRLELPMNDIDVQIPQASLLQIHPRGEATLVKAVMAPGPEISIRWRRKTEAVEKAPPKLYSEVFHLVSIDDDALKLNTEIVYNVLHKEIDHVRFSVPADLNVLRISGEGLGEWQEIGMDEKREVLVPFTYSKKGRVSINMSSEIPLNDHGMTNAFTGIRTLDTVRENGFIGIELNTSAEVKVAECTGMEKVTAGKLPGQLYHKSIKPLIYAFRYLKHPYGLILDVQKHDKLSVPEAAIPSASMVTLFTEDGKVVHRMVYQVRNSAKQFLELTLPEKSNVWTVFVDDKPVESSVNPDGKLLVPLIRSRSADNRLMAFPVEVVYCEVGERFNLSGYRQSCLPGADVLISRLIWSVYLPNDYSYHYFDGTLEKEEMIRGIHLFTGARRQYNDKAMQEAGRSLGQNGPPAQKEQFERIYKGHDYQSEFRNLPMQKKQIVHQLKQELRFSGRLNSLVQQSRINGSPAGANLLPIEIEIPTGGHVYRFAKTIVTREDPLTIRMTYTRNIISRAAFWFSVFLAGVLTYVLRKKIRRLVISLRVLVDAFLDHLKPYHSAIQAACRSVLTTLALLGMFIAACFISGYAALSFFLVLWVSMSYQLILYWKKRSVRKTGPEAPAEETALVQPEIRSEPGAES